MLDSERSPPKDSCRLGAMTWVQEVEAEIAAVERRCARENLSEEELAAHVAVLTALDDTIRITAVTSATVAAIKLRRVAEAIRSGGDCYDTARSADLVVKDVVDWLEGAVA